MWRAFWTGLGLTRGSHGQSASRAQPARLGDEDPEGTRRRLVWNRPQHLSDTEADAWAWAQLDEFLGSDGLQRAEVGLIAAEPAKHGDLVVDSADGRCIQAPASRALV